MLFLEVTLLRVPAWSSCLGQTGDLIWTTLCTKMYLLYWRCCFRGCGSAEVCPRPGNICEAVRRSLTTMFVYGYQFLDMHITATIPYDRDIIYSKHNKCVKECLACFNVRKVCETRQRIHILATVLVIQLTWACHLSWSSIMTPRWRCSETCSIACDFS